MIVTTFPLGNEDQKIGEEGAFKPFLWDGHNSSSSQHIGMKPWVISTVSNHSFGVKITKLYGQRGFLLTYMLTRFARHQFQNAKVAPHPSVNIWQIANHSIWHKERLLWRSELIIHQRRLYYTGKKNIVYTFFQKSRWRVRRHV